ncbi:MAG TPA: helix-turn-helix domain-containing protein [Chloroflexia bacterium]|nr:helix-turn-helix domain-containing protein [Chloroflexia bacterium]
MVESSEMAAAFQPEQERVIGDLETLRVVADPLRIQILETALEEPRTVKQIGKLLNLPPAKLYYHVNALEEHGLLRVVGTRLVSGITEKQYRVTVLRIRFDRNLLSQADSRDEALNLMLSSVLDSTRQDIETVHRSVAGGLIDLAADAPANRKMLIIKTFSRLTPEQAAEFHRRLGELVDDFGAACADDTQTQAYSLTMLMHPSALSLADDPDSAPDS